MIIIYSQETSFCPITSKNTFGLALTLDIWNVHDKLSTLYDTCSIVSLHVQNTFYFSAVRNDNCWHMYSALLNYIIKSYINSSCRLFLIYKILTPKIDIIFNKFSVFRPAENYKKISYLSEIYEFFNCHKMYGWKRNFGIIQIL